MKTLAIVRRWIRIVLWPAGLLLALLLYSCTADLPTLDGRRPSVALRDTSDTRLGRAISPRVQAHPGLSGLAPLISGSDAFAARVLMAEAAERSLDLAYYIWQQDMSGTLLLGALHRAADRGVRVRLLLDDNNTDGLDPLLATLNAHPNVEVRLFNPFAHRRWRALGYLTDFPRLNRRMHNKSFTADNQATIIGGRNIGDEYFDAGGDALFVDLDVLAVGPVVDAVSSDFDLYWASGSSYPVERLLPPAEPGALAALAERASLTARDPAAAEYVAALRDSPFVRQLLEGRLELVWAPTRLVSDDPAKGLGLADEEGLLLERLQTALDGPAERELLLVSPYFVPTRVGVETLTSLVRRGVRVTVLTNSLEATDVTLVHAGYAKRRMDLLVGGVELYEMKRESNPPDRLRDRGLAGSSASSLHAKTFAIDGERLFIGSFNFDPRSARLNTEMGFVIHSPELAGAVAAAFAGPMPEHAYEVRLGEDGELRWLERMGGETRVHLREPGAGVLKGALLRLVARLPIEWLL